MELFAGGDICSKVEAACLTGDSWSDWKGCMVMSVDLPKYSMFLHLLSQSVWIYLYAQPEFAEKNLAHKKSSVSAC